MAWWIGLMVVAVTPAISLGQFDADLVWILRMPNTLVMVNNDKLLLQSLAQRTTGRLVASRYLRPASRFCRRASIE